VRKSIRAGVIAASALSLVSLTACANLETQGDVVGIRYSGGAIFPEAIEFKECQGKSEQHFGAAGDNTYTYPVGQRTFKFSNDPGSDSPPLTTSAPGPNGGQPIEMQVSGTVFFTPKFANCDTLRKFHETIGLKYRAWIDNGFEGWNEAIGVYIKDPTDRTVDNESLKSDWIKLSSNAEAKHQWETNVTTELPKLMEQSGGGEFFHIDYVILQKPDLPANVKSAIADTEAARQQAQTAEQVKNAAASFPGGVQAYQEYQRNQAVNKAIESGNVKVIPVPAGSPIMVNAN